MPTRCTLLRRALLLALIPAAAKADEPLDVPALMARLAAVTGRRAAFREEKRIGALTTPLMSRGELVYRRPGYLEKRTDWPERETLVVEGDRIVLTAGDDVPRVVPLSVDAGLRAAIEAFRAPLAGDLAALNRSFAVRGTGTAVAWRLDLVPTDPAVSRLLRSVQVDGTGSDVRAVVVTQTNGDTQRLTIEP